MVDSLFDYALINAVNVEIPIIVEREFVVQCCIRGYHIYQSQWDAEEGVKLTTAPDKRPGALVRDKYAIAVENNGQTVGHVPEFLSKLTFFFLKYGGKLQIKVNGPRRYSADLKQGGLEIPAQFYFKSSNEKLFCQMKEKVLTEIETFEKQRREIEEEKKRKESKKRKTQRMNK